jgi:hypothetical protein
MQMMIAATESSQNPTVRRLAKTLRNPANLANIVF